MNEGNSLLLSLWRVLLSFSNSDVISPIVFEEDLIRAQEGCPVRCISEMMGYYSLEFTTRRHARLSPGSVGQGRKAANEEKA